MLKIAFGLCCSFLLTGVGSFAGSVTDPPPPSTWGDFFIGNPYNSADHITVAPSAKVLDVVGGDEWNGFFALASVAGGAAPEILLKSYATSAA